MIQACIKDIMERVPSHKIEHIERLILKIISWNVQGRGGHFHLYKRMRGSLHLELQNLLIGGPIDILMFQEHHLNKCRCASYGSILQGN